MMARGKGALSFLQLTHPPEDILFSIFYLLVMLLAGCVTLGKLVYLSHSEPRFGIYKIGKVPVSGVLEGSNGIIHIIHLTRCLGHSLCSRSGNYYNSHMIHRIHCLLSDKNK